MLERLGGVSGPIFRPYRAIGRFAHLRRAYSGLRHILDVGQRPIAAASATLFPTLSEELCCGGLRGAGLFLGLHLAGDLVASIRGFAESAHCQPHGSSSTGFRYAEVRDGRLGDGRPVPVADVEEPQSCPVVDSLCRDGALLSIARRHLGYRPGRVDTRLFWSFAGALPDTQRRRLGQTIDFHYDVPWYNALYVYFYLTDTDRASGAHVVLPGSARDKPLSFILAPCFRPDADLAAYYGADPPIVIEGPAGFGFFEDPYCYHKALAPVTRDRLMLQLRFR